MKILFLRQGFIWCFFFQLANSLVPSEIKPGISVATVSAVLHSKDNKHTLQVCEYWHQWNPIKTK